ncbi:MAG: hypothetical protein U0746_10080 [Gemmataceae bacterium]
MKRLTRLALLLVLGCGGTGPRMVPVEGAVAFTDGSSVEVLKGYNVEFERVDRIDGKLVSSVGTLAADGSFRLTTTKPGDGAFEGNYRVVIGPPATTGDGPPPSKHLPPKYGAFDTSGLTTTIAPGSPRVMLMLERMKRN